MATYTIGILPHHRARSGPEQEIPMATYTIGRIDFPEEAGVLLRQIDGVARTFPYTIADPAGGPGTLTIEADGTLTYDESGEASVKSVEGDSPQGISFTATVSNERGHESDLMTVVVDLADKTATVLHSLNLSASTIYEDAGIGTIVGTVKGQTSGSILTLPEDAGGLFALSGTDLVIASALDFEETAAPEVVVRETIKNSSQDTTLAITVRNVAEKELATLELSSASIAANAPQGAVVGSLVGRTPGSALMLIGHAGRRFALSGTNIVRGGTPLGDATSHDITVRESISDATNSPRETRLAISVAGLLDAPTTISQQTVPILAAVSEGRTALMAYEEGAPGTYSADNGQIIDSISHQFVVDGKSVAGNYVLSAEEAISVVETVTASDGTKASFSSAPVLVEAASIAFAAATPQTISLSAVQSGNSFDLDEWFTGGVYPYSYAIRSDDTPATTLDGTTLTIGGMGFSGAVVVRGTDADGATSDLTLDVTVAAEALHWTGPLPTIHITEGETISIDLGAILGGTPSGSEVFAVDGLPDGLSVNQSSPSIDGAATLAYVAPVQTDFTIFAEHPAEAGKVCATLRSDYEVPADCEVRIYFGESENPDLTTDLSSVAIAPGETYHSTGTWPESSVLYQKAFLKRRTDGVIVDLRDLGSFVIATPADTTAPTLTGATANPKGETGGKAYVTPDESCTIHARVRPASASLADAATIQSEGQAASGSNGVAANFLFSGLTTGNPYAVDFVAVDGAGNVSAVVSSGRFTPAAVPAGAITINDFSRDYSIFGSAPQLGRSYAEVPLSGTGTPGQVIEAKTSDGTGSALFSSTRDAVLALFDRTNPNGVQTTRSLLSSPANVSVPANVSRDIGQKRITVESGTWTIQNMNFDGWFVSIKGGATLVSDNCVFGNPTADLRSYSSPWFVHMYRGSRWDATYCSIESRGDYSEASRKLIHQESVDPRAGETADQLPIVNWYRCRSGGQGSDTIYMARGSLKWCYFDAAVLSDFNIGNGVHSDTISLMQCHPTEGLDIQACYISNDGTHRPSDYPYPDKIINDPANDAGRNNIIRFDMTTRDGLGLDWGEVRVLDCVFRPTPGGGNKAFHTTSFSGISVTPPMMARNQFLTLGNAGSYWYTPEDLAVKWDQNIGPSGDTLPPPEGATVTFNAGPAPSIASWDDPALGASGESWFTVATVDGSGDWSGICRYPRKAGWYLPTVRVQGGDGTEVSSSTRCGAGFDLAIHGQSNCSYPWMESYESSSKNLAPPFPVNNPNILQIVNIRRSVGEAPKPASLTRVSDTTPYSAGACMFSNAINDLTGGIPVMVRVHAVAGRALQEEVDDTNSKNNWADEKSIHDLGSADGSQVDGHFQYLEGGTNIGSSSWDDFVGAACFGVRANGDAFRAPGTVQGRYITNSLREFYDPNHTKFGWFSREADHAYKFRGMTRNANLATFFLAKHEGFSPNRGWWRGYISGGTSLRDDNHSGLLAYDGAPRKMGMMGLNMLQMIGAIPGGTGVIDRIRLHPNGNAKAVALGSSVGPLTTLRRSIGYFPTDLDNTNQPPRDKTRLAGKPEAVRFTFNDVHLDNTEIRDDGHSLADEGWIWLYKNEGSDWSEADLTGIGYAGSSSWHGATFPENYLDGFRYADIPSLATGENHVGAITIQDRLPSDLGTNSKYRV